MKPKRGETAEQTIDRWAHELIASTMNKPLSAMSTYDFDRVIEQVDWLKARLEVLKTHNS